VNTVCGESLGTVFVRYVGEELSEYVFGHLAVLVIVQELKPLPLSDLEHRPGIQSVH
jgi:hypothetical protein